MRTAKDSLAAPEETHAELHIMQELGRSIRLSLEGVTSEGRPREMGLLLLRLAMAEVLSKAADEEARESGREMPPEERYLALRGAWAYALSGAV